MKYIYLFFWFTSVFAQAHNLEMYLKDLEELGYCVIPEVLSNEEAKVLYQRVWHEYIEKAWPKLRMEDRSNWKESFPTQDKYGIFAGPAGQIQVMWDLRQDPRIVEIFAKIWNTEDLIVSMDGLSFMCPPEIREGYVEPWPHADQGITYNNPPPDFVSESSLNTKPFTIQGQFLFEDSFEGDGGFYCIPKSHLQFDDYAPRLEAIYALNIPMSEKWKAEKTFLISYFLGNEKKHITAPCGSLILWDSRTVHWNQHAIPERKIQRVRMVGYLCYVPKARLTDEGRALRKKAFETGVSTGHNPANPVLRFTKNRIHPEFERYMEDPSYIQPKIHLTPLGESLL